MHALWFAFQRDSSPRVLVGGLLWETLGFPVLDEHFLVSVCLVGSVCHVPNITGDGNTDLHLYYHDFVMCPSYGEILL